LALDPGGRRALEVTWGRGRGGGECPWRGQGCPERREGRGGRGKEKRARGVQDRLILQEIVDQEKLIKP